jgi:hypothetical protein
MVSGAVPAPGRVMEEARSSPRPRLILYATRAQNGQKNAVAATLAWLAEATGLSFEVYYDAPRQGGHYGGGDPRSLSPEVLTGGLVTGGRHLERVALALQRFQTTVVCSGPVAIANTVAALAGASGTQVYEVAEENLADLYSWVLSVLQMRWPTTAVMLNAAPSPNLAGIDAYCYPEIVYRHALGFEATLQEEELHRLRLQGTEEILTCGISLQQQAVLSELGFQVHDLGTICEGDDYATVTSRLARQWRAQREGWLIGDPALASSWLPTACRERRAAIYGIPQSRVIDLLSDEIASTSVPVLGRQFEDADFFQLSGLGQSFQLVDPDRPVLPVLQGLTTPWASSVRDPRSADPTDEELRTWARDGRVLASLVFWTGMMRETENLYALMDLLALTDLHSGLALTSQTLRWRPSPLDLLTVPREGGGVYPNVEILLASCGDGAAIESLLPPGRLGGHLATAWRELEGSGLPRVMWPEGWWATMDAPLLPLPRERAPGRVRRRREAPFVQFRFHPRSDNEAIQAVAGDRPRGPAPSNSDSITADLRRRARVMVRDSPMSRFFEAYRPYEHFEPGPVLPHVAREVQHAGFSYMLSKSGFGQPPRRVWRDGDFVALNYTAGQWDGWTPFETVNNVYDLRRAEKRLLSAGKPGWLLGSIDTCLWAFSGELWQRAPGLAAIARFISRGGTSGALINVTPRVIARYARLLADPASPE